MKDSELEDIIREANQPSRHTKEQFMNLCPGIIPLCDEELNWWEEWLDNHPDEKANSEIAYYEYCKKQSAEWFCHKLFLRMFLDEHSIRGQGDFVLRYEGKNVTIKPFVPTGKEFKFKL